MVRAIVYCWAVPAVLGLGILAAVVLPGEADTGRVMVGLTVMFSAQALCSLAGGALYLKRSRRERD